MKRLLILLFLSATAATLSGQSPASPGDPPPKETRRLRPPPVISPDLTEDGNVTFRIKAPNASEVFLRGQWPDGQSAMVKGDNDVWNVTAGPIEPGVWEYSFQIDGVTMIDPGNPAIKPMRSPRTSILHIPGQPSLIHDFQEVPHGVVHQHTYRSQSLGRLRELAVYTPPGYDKQSTTVFPTLYLQHGSGDNHATWTVHGKAHWILDNLISQGKAVPMVVVMMDGHASKDRATNTELFERDLLEDVMPFVEATYRIKTESAGRAFVGLSMGGGQSLSIGLRHTDTFGWVGGFSSSVPQGEKITSALENVDATNKNLKLLWIACGKDDFLLQRNKEFIGLLTENKIAHRWLLTDGDHSWPIWRRYLADFYPLLFQNSQEEHKALSIPASDDGIPGAGPIRRYDWFQKLWNQKRLGWSQRVDQDQHALVFLGDSITQGWTSLEEDFAGSKVANRGISGDTTRGMLLRLQADVLDLNPSGVVMLMGTNDLEEGAEPETIANNLKLILAALKKHNSRMPIVLCRVFPSSSSKKRPTDKIQEINRLYAAAVKGDGQVHLVDTWKLFANSSGDAKQEEFPDLLHPNQKGYVKWAAALRPVLEALGLIESTPDTFTPEAGFVPLFNGRDLTGWGYRVTSKAMRRQAEGWKRNDPNAPPWPFVEEALDFAGKTTSNDGRYIAGNQRLVVTSPPEGRKIQQLWTTNEFVGDFTLKLEFRAMPNADSGVFLRGPQLQCRDFPLAGPYKDLKKFKPQAWNTLEVIVTGETARCLVNGEVIEEAFKVPAKGPIGLEGDRGQMEYRRIRLKQN